MQPANDAGQTLLPPSRAQLLGAALGRQVLLLLRVTPIVLGAWALEQSHYTLAVAAFAWYVERERETPGAEHAD